MGLPVVAQNPRLWWVATTLMVGAAVAAGWWIAPKPGPDAPPQILISDVQVAPLVSHTGTDLHIATVYTNTGCDRILLARFLINTHPTPSIALPQQQGLSTLPPDKNQMLETVSLGFDLAKGQWHLFSQATCYVDGKPLANAIVSPTALFEVQ
jgi:hypothetical protein